MINLFKIYAFASILILSILNSYAGEIDTTKTVSTFSGSVGITNNGFSIIPTFSLNSPATIINLSFRRKRFSIEPDFRLVPNLSKGGLLFWLRYRLVDNKKFSLRVGTHPAFSLIRKTINNNGKDLEITEMLRFAAIEVAPTYKIKPNWSVGAMFLNGNALQNHGPQTTYVLFLNTSISNINIGGDNRFQFIPLVFFLNLDGSRGDYFSATSIFSNKNSPFTIQGTINKTLKSNIAGNQDFMWNVMLAYNFSKNYIRVK
jgi:hypothetical protein